MGWSSKVEGQGEESMNNGGGESFWALGQGGGRMRKTRPSGRGWAVVGAVLKDSFLPWGVGISGAGLIERLTVKLSGVRDAFIIQYNSMDKSEALPKCFSISK